MERVLRCGGEGERKLRCSTTRITSLAQAVLTLHPTSSERGRKSLTVRIAAL
ncbi:hypothetical protein GTW59_12615 [Streptomyces sp. SID89]|nr:hypothetical protein [Streptomyces sp. SID89]